MPGKRFQPELEGFDADFAEPNCDNDPQLRQLSLLRRQGLTKLLNRIADEPTPHDGEPDIEVQVLPPGLAGERQRKVLFWQAQRRAKGLPATKTALYGAVGKDKADYYRWERGELPNGSQSDLDYRRILHEG